MSPLWERIIRSGQRRKSYGVYVFLFYSRITAAMLQVRCSHCPRSEESLSLEPHRRTTSTTGGQLSGVKHSFPEHQTI